MKFDKGKRQLIVSGTNETIEQAGKVNLWASRVELRCQVEFT